MIKITGLDQLTKQIEDAKRALEGLDGELGRVSFDPNDPGSIESAIQRLEAMIDERLGRFSSNSIIGPLASNMKEKYRKGILDHAAAERLKKDGE